MSKSESQTEKQVKRNFYDLEQMRKDVFSERLSKAGIYLAVKKGDIPVVKIGKRLLVPSWFVNQLISERPNSI